MPSILIVTTVDITLEAFLQPFAEHLRSLGWRVDALANGAEGNDRIAAAFDERFEIGWTRNPFSLASLTATRRAREVVTSGGYDIVWVHTPVAAMIARHALRHTRPGAPAVVYTAHGFHFLEGGPAVTNALYRAIERRAARRTDFLVTINAEDFAAARSFDAIATERVRLIPGIGVDTAAYHNASLAKARQVRQELEAGPDAFVLTMIAEFTPNKRHTLALEALEHLTATSVVLAFVGSGAFEERVRAEAARLGLEDRVRFVGYRRDIPAVLAASDALLLCSAREGLNRSGLEAMAAGLPVIGTPTRGIADLIGAGEAGWVAASHSPEDLAAAIDAAAADPTERARRGAAARERALAEYSLDRILAAYDALFAEALALRGEAR